MGVSLEISLNREPNLVRLGAKERNVDTQPYFCKYRNMENGSNKRRAERGGEEADKFSAMGKEPRLRIMQLVFSGPPGGVGGGGIQGEMGIPNFKLFDHLGKLENERRGNL